MRTRILVVEDDQQQRDGLAAFLKGKKFYVETAVDGLDAVQRARLAWFDVILMDYRLPEVDGLAAARLIGDLTRDHGSPKIIALTASRESILEGGPETGKVFFSVEQKPWQPAALLDAIQRAQAPCNRAEPVSGHGAAARRWPPARPSCLAATPHKRGDPWRILIVDDDVVPRALLGAMLAARGYQVDEAADGLQAVLMIGNESYHAAIIDYGLPKMNGVAAARLVTDLLAQADRPYLIALTAHPELVHAKEDGFASAFAAIVGKSNGLDAVIDAVEGCLQPGGARIFAGLRALPS